MDAPRKANPATPAQLAAGRVIACSIAASVAVSAALAAFSLLAPYSLSPTGSAPPTTLGAAERQARESAFNASLPLPLQQVDKADIPKAAATLHLPKGTHLSVWTSATPAPPADTHAAPRLAWVSLWDSDRDNGDVVRLFSAGYGRTLSLTRQPQTFAIPVASDGQVVLYGVREGPGGGITLGFGSGPRHVLLPVMAVNQRLSFTVKVQ